MAFIKPLLVVTYAVFGLLLLLLAAGKQIPVSRITHPGVRIAFGLATCLIGLWFTLHGYPFLISVVLGTAVFAIDSRNLTFGAVAVVIVSVSLAWWLGAGPQPSEWWRPVLFALLLWCGQAGFMRGNYASRRNRIPLLFLVFSIAGIALLTNTTQYQPGSEALRLLVHHQGAYIGPALQVRAGLVPYYDIPLQYGLGPTLSIAAACGSQGCWPEMAFLMAASTLTMGLLILGMALSTRPPRGTIWRITTTLVVFAAVFVWPGFSFLGSIPASAPSTGGLRFLPVTMIAFLLFFRRHRLAAAMLAPAILWSPETAVMSLVVFGVPETSRLGLLKAATRALGIAVATVSAFVVLHHLVYGVWVQPDVVAEYILHVPGAMPIDLMSNFIALVAACALAAWNVCRPHADQLDFRRDLVTTSLLFAATSYYLGRSHANNICNLMPFLVLAALRTLDGKAPASFLGLPKLAALGMSAATAALALSPWYYAPFQHGFSTDTRPLAAAAARLDSDMLAVRSHIFNPEHLGIADLGHLNRNPLETTVWTPMDPGSLWRFVPSNRRQIYIRRSAARLGLSGWVILSENQKDWLNDFRVAYRIVEEKSYKTGSATYLVAHLAPLVSTSVRQ